MPSPYRQEWRVTVNEYKGFFSGEAKRFKIGLQ